VTHPLVIKRSYEFSKDECKVIIIINDKEMYPNHNYIKQMKLAVFLNFQYLMFHLVVWCSILE
jgi:hypothetical protein